ncbi:MAG: PIN domain-containing protein [Crocosphaera sp.]|jgi:predicted nucleic acid-binding protein
MRIVIDPNVLISAVVAGGNTERVILFVAENEDFQWIVSDYILGEYKRVLRRKNLSYLNKKNNDGLIY